MTNTDKLLGEGIFAYLLSDAAFKVVVCTPENEKLLIEILELLIPGAVTDSFAASCSALSAIALTSCISAFN